jgi:hypothetical protein
MCLSPGNCPNLKAEVGGTADREASRKTNDQHSYAPSFTNNKTVLEF